MTPSRRARRPARQAALAGVAALAVASGSLVWGATSADASQLTAESSIAVGPTSSAAATGFRDAARYGAGYLARQITANGGYLAPFGSPDDGNTAYAVVALTAAGVGGNASRSAIAYLKTRIADGLTDSSGADNAGTLANLVLAAVAAGENPRAFGGTTDAHNLVARLQATRRTSGPDRGLFGAADPTYDGAYRQGLALTALKAAGVAPTNVATAEAWLERQQCADGLWASYRADTAVPCSAADLATFSGPDTNSTALAVEGLEAYGSAPMRWKTLAALGAVQSTDGGFPFLAAPGQASEPNSTAVVIQALVATGSKPTWGRWVKGGRNPYQALSAYQLGCGDTTGDRGAYYYPGSRTANVLATVQAVPAQVGASLPVTHQATRPGAPTLSCVS